jgi:hypothetical protein
VPHISQFEVMGFLLSVILSSLFNNFTVWKEQGCSAEMQAECITHKLSFKGGCVYKIAYLITYTHTKICRDEI